MGMVVDVFTPTGVITRDSKELVLSFNIIDRLLEPEDRFCKLYFKNDESNTDGIPKALCVYMSILDKELIIDMGTPVSVNDGDDYDDEPIVSSDGGERWTTGRINLYDPWGSVIEFLNSFEKVLKVEKNIDNLKRVGINDLACLYNEVSRVFMELTGCAAFQMLKYIGDNWITDKITCDRYPTYIIRMDTLKKNMSNIIVELSPEHNDPFINIIYNKIYHNHIIKLFWKLMYCIANHPVYSGERKEIYDDYNNEG